MCSNEQNTTTATLMAEAGNPRLTVIRYQETDIRRDNWGDVIMIHDSDMEVWSTVGADELIYRITTEFAEIDARHNLNRDLPCPPEFTILVNGASSGEMTESEQALYDHLYMEIEAVKKTMSDKLTAELRAKKEQKEAEQREHEKRQQRERDLKELERIKMRLDGY